MRTAAALALAILLAATAVWAGGPVGFVAAARGEARVNSQAARVGMEVFAGDRLVTGDKSRLKVLLSDDVILALGSGTEVVVEKHLFDPHSGARSTRLDLLNGKLRSLVQKLVAGSRADFEVKTTNAVAGVRGTEFVLVADGKQTHLYTYSGEVDLSGEGGERVVVAAGQGSDVGDEGQAHKPEAVAAAVLKRLRQATDTRQSPQAVAWNLEVGRGDRLVAGAGGAEVAEEGELDQEALASGVPPLGDTDPKINPCGSCGPDDGLGPETTTNRFGGDVAEGVQDVGGFGWDNTTPIDRGSLTPLTLKITFNYSHRP
jgi:hypothetical protein